MVPPPPCVGSAVPAFEDYFWIIVNAANPHDDRFYPQTGFRIDNDTIADYFARRGGVRTFGYPISRTFLFQGFLVNFSSAAWFNLTRSATRNC